MSYIIHIIQIRKLSSLKYLDHCISESKIWTRNASVGNEKLLVVTRSVGQYREQLGSRMYVPVYFAIDRNIPGQCGNALKLHAVYCVQHK